MDEYGYLDFTAISHTPFKQVLSALEVPFKEEGKKLITEQEVINAEKNLYFEKGGAKGELKGGSVIKFVSAYKHCSLREAAFFIKSLSGEPVREEKRIPELTLTYHPYLSEIPEDICQSLKVGFCKEKSIMAGHICFKVGQHYIGYNPEKKTWLFPKQFQVNTLWNVENCYGETIVITVNPFDSLFLLSQDYPDTASILRVAITEEQAVIIRKYKRALILHDEPQNLVEKLVGHLFIKTHPAINRPTKEQVLSLL
jgi:hypothetical protein